MYQTDDNLSVAFADGQNEIRKSQAAERMRERVERIRASKAMNAAAVPSLTMPEQTEQAAGSWADKAGAVAKDITLGATVEAPRALAHGALNAVNEGLQSIYQLGDWRRPGWIPGVFWRVRPGGMEERQCARRQGSPAPEHGRSEKYHWRTSERPFSVDGWHDADRESGPSGRTVQGRQGRCCGFRHGARCCDRLCFHG